MFGFGISRKKIYKTLDTWNENRSITSITKKKLEEFLITIFAFWLFISAFVAGSVVIVFFLCFILTQNAIFFACFIGAAGLCALPIFTGFIAVSIVTDHKAKLENERRFR